MVVSGGDAFQADVACILINNGTIRAGGGGGGAGGNGGSGGTGGGGQYTTTSEQVRTQWGYPPYNFCRYATGNDFKLCYAGGFYCWYWLEFWWRLSY